MSYLHNYKIDTSYNFSSILRLPCICCGKSFNKKERIDTVDVFGIDESWCLEHWWDHILDIKHDCLKREQFENLIFD